jgi:hypothetical protein
VNDRSRASRSGGGRDSVSRIGCHAVSHVTLHFVH